MNPHYMFWRSQIFCISQRSPFNFVICFLCFITSFLMIAHFLFLVLFLICSTAALQLIGYRAKMLAAKMFTVRRPRPCDHRSPVGAFSIQPAPWGPWNPHPQDSYALGPSREGQLTSKPLFHWAGRGKGCWPFSPLEPSTANLLHLSCPCWHHGKVFLLLAYSAIRAQSPQHTWLCAYLLPAESTCFPSFCSPITPAPFPHLAAPLIFSKKRSTTV